MLTDRVSVDGEQLELQLKREQDQRLFVVELEFGLACCLGMRLQT